jgi:hypothetical protein
MTRGPGRPSKLTTERRDLFVSAIKEGNYVEVAAAVAGIHTSTVYNWMARGREAKTGEFREFFDAVKEAEAFAERTAVGQVRRAGAIDTRNWAAAMTFLERRFRDRWARPAQVAEPVGGGRDILPPGPPDLTDEPVVIPVGQRLTGILDALQAAGKLDGHGPDSPGSTTLPVRGNGRGPAGNGTG